MIDSIEIIVDDDEVGNIREILFKKLEDEEEKELEEDPSYVGEDEDQLILDWRDPK